MYLVEQADKLSSSQCIGGNYTKFDVWIAVSKVFELCEGCGGFKWSSSQCFTGNPSRKPNCMAKPFVYLHSNNSKIIYYLISPWKIVVYVINDPLKW